MGLKTALPFFAIAAFAFVSMHLTIFPLNGDLMVPSLLSKKHYPSSSDGLRTFVSFGRACFGKRETQLVLTTFGASLPSAIAIFLLESCRRSNPAILTLAPTLYLLLSQAITTGVIVPLWFGLFALFAWSKDKAGALDDEKEAVSMQAYIPAFLLGYMLPTTATLLQSHFAHRLTPQQMDLCNVTWQVYPISIAVIAFVFRSVVGPPRAPSRAARRSTDSLLFLAGAFSTAWHYYFLYSVVTESRSLAPKTFLSSVLPKKTTQPDVQTVLAAFGNVFKFGPSKVGNMNDLAHVFLSIDGVLTILPILLFAALYRTRGGERIVESVVRTLVEAAVFGPGASCVYAYWIGQESRRLEKKKEVREKKLD